jgi:alcohol-forming fatty acyl-CoA reductase
MLQETSEVVQYFKDKSIFITGATGFLGKVLIEKLLRSCTSIKAIYVLIRGKKGKEPRERLNDLFDCELFDKLNKIDKDYAKKVIPIVGDILEPNLGISPHDETLLVNNVNIIIHSAATVRFDEALKLAFEMNVNGLKKIINLAKRTKNLEVLIHVSTCYANCDQSFIDEKVYKSTIDLKNLSQTLEWMDNDMADLITPKILKRKPNTYTFTKALAENVLSEYMNELPLAIVRPSIVVASWKEPFPGWIDNSNGPTGLLLASGKGVLRSMLGDRKLIADFLPVDTCVNVIILSAWLRGSIKTQNSLIYNCSSGQINPLRWSHFEDSCRDALAEFPFDAPLLVPTLPLITPYKSIVIIRRFFEQILIAYTYDFLKKLTLKKHSQ